MPEFVKLFLAVGSPVIAYLITQFLPIRIHDLIIKSAPNIIRLFFVFYCLIFVYYFITALNVFGYAFYVNRWAEHLLPFPFTGFYFGMYGLAFAYFLRGALVISIVAFIVIMLGSLGSILGLGLFGVMLSLRHQKAIKIMPMFVILALMLLQVAVVRRAGVDIACIDRWFQIDMALDYMLRGDLDWVNFLFGGMFYIEDPYIYMNFNCVQMLYSMQYVQHNAYNIVFIHNDFFRIFFNFGLVGICFLIFNVLWSLKFNLLIYPICVAVSQVNPLVYSSFFIPFSLFFLVHFSFVRVGVRRL